MPRLFTAIEIPVAVRPTFTNLKIEKGAIYQNQPHITLHFIGDVSSELTSILLKELKSIELNQFSLPIKGVGAFTEGKTPHFLWAGVTTTIELLDLHDAIGAVLAQLGKNSQEREYNPHITVARLDSENEALVNSFLSSNSDFELGLRVKSFALYKSEFIKAHPTYTKLYEYQLVE